MTFIDVREEKFPDFKVRTTNRIAGTLYANEDIYYDDGDKPSNYITIEQAIAGDIKINGFEYLDDKKKAKEILEYVSKYQKVYKPSLLRKIWNKVASIVEGQNPGAEDARA